jgi:hypothetical protein
MLHELLLPSGVAIRFAPVDTQTHLEAQADAAEFVGGKVEDTKTAAYQVRLHQRLVFETMARTIKFVAGPVRVEETTVMGGKDGKEQIIVPDVDATLDKLTEKDWKPVNYVMLKSNDSPLRLPELLKEPADFGVMLSHIEQSISTVKNVHVFTGKARKISG